MTVKYSATLAQLFLGAGVLGALAGAHAITIYSGTKPTAAAIAAAFASYNSGNANFLAHYVGASFSQSSYLASLNVPSAVNASNTGTGSWAIIWATNTALASMNGALPTTSFIVVDVSDSAGTGIIRFTSLAFTSGASKAILDGSIGCAMS